MATGKQIADAAKAALAKDGFETEASYCQRFVKQVLRSVGVGTSVMPDGLASARIAFKEMERRGYALPSGTRPKAGDLLYKVGDGAGKYGHVGIYGNDGRVYENSSAHVGGRDRDARGWRTLPNFGRAYRIVRVAKK